jgi:hypothetical protein
MVTKTMKMVDDGYFYTYEKLCSAVQCLATHPGDVRERLTGAFLAFHTLTEKDFPKEYRKDWTWINKELTKYGPLLNHKGEVWRGSVDNTMRRIKNKTALKIAERIVKLFWVINDIQRNN